MDKNIEEQIETLNAIIDKATTQRDKLQENLPEDRRLNNDMFFKLYYNKSKQPQLAVLAQTNPGILKLININIYCGLCFNRVNDYEYTREMTLIQLISQVKSCGVYDRIELVEDNVDVFIKTIKECKENNK